MIANLIKPGDSFIFFKDIFIKDYYDKENNLPNEVNIINKMKYGVLLYNNKVIKENFTFKIENSNLLKYVRLSKLQYTEEINFQVSDKNQNTKFSEMKTFTINVNAYENLPPDAIGDGELTVENGEVIVLTKEDFTTNTTPPYDDPEGDAPYKLKILELPTDGSKLSLDGVLVTLNQEILFTDIEAGLLTIEQTPNQASHSFTFGFDISDVGSEEYSGL